jgi:hypothetical protein
MTRVVTAMMAATLISGELESEGRIDSQGDGAIFEAGIVVWVFQHEVASRDAYDKFHAACRKATGAQRRPSG